jgi:RTX calcium-binding nonapeptide repeat (4 copies)
VSRNSSQWCAGIVGFVLVLSGSVPAIANGGSRTTSEEAAVGRPSPGTTPIASPAPGKFLFNTSDSQFDAGVDNQGWWSPDNKNNDINDNYIAGRSVGAFYRDFFTFDLSSLKSRVYRATLKLRRYRDLGSPTETWVLFDVSTGARKLNNNHGMNASIYRDLGTGSRYGTFHPSTEGRNDSEVRSFALNENAVARINAARGRFFSIGGNVTSAEDGGTLFAFSTGHGIQRLVLRGCSITGTNGPDVLVGTEHSDIICAKSGADSVFSRGGDDLVLSGRGNDLVATGAGRDVVRAGYGSDTVVGRGGKDRLDGHRGRDILRGGKGSDRLIGGLGVDVVEGGLRSDQLEGRSGNDVLGGGSGPDKLDGGIGKDVCRGGRGTDTLRRCERRFSEVGERLLRYALVRLRDVRKQR